MKKPKSGDHALVLKVLALEGSKHGINIADGKEFLSCLKSVLLCNEKLRMGFIQSLYQELFEYEVRLAASSVKRKSGRKK